MTLLGNILCHLYVLIVNKKEDRLFYLRSVFFPVSNKLKPLLFRSTKLHLFIINDPLRPKCHSAYLPKWPMSPVPAASPTATFSTQLLRSSAGAM